MRFLGFTKKSVFQEISILSVLVLWTTLFTSALLNLAKMRLSNVF